MNFLLERLSSLMSTILIVLPTTLVALMGHEVAHGWVSTKLGDPTPKREGRLSFNPLMHLDPMGTILMVLTGFGWAKPVSVNPMYYKNRKQGMALVAIAGPLANLIMAVIAAVVGLILMRIFNNSAVSGWVYTIVTVFVRMNLGFMIFNIIPIPPLDGSKVLGVFLPNRAYYTMLQYERYSMILIMVLSLSGALDRIIGTGVMAMWNAVWNFAIGLVF